MSSVKQKQRAERRAAKAARREKAKAMRSRETAQANASSSLALQVRQLTAAPFHACLVQEGMFERGNGVVAVVKKTAGGRYALAMFLADVFCLGVKDVVFHVLDFDEYEDFLESTGSAATLRSADPAYARKLLRDLVVWSRSIGFEPHKDYADAERIFGGVLADACNESFAFGQDGKPLYIPGPHDSPGKIRKQMEHLRRRLGEGGFDCLIPTDDPADDEDEFDEDLAVPELDGPAFYDPLEAPEAGEWLALDEDEQLASVMAYHEAEGLADEISATHSVCHVAVETQCALGDETPVRRTIERLMQEGLDRHEAVHAVGTLLTGRLYDALQAGTVNDDAANDSFFAEVERLTAESWRKSFEQPRDAAEQPSSVPTRH